VPDAITQLTEHLRDGQLLVLRSTVYPGVTRLTESS
jgi:UDP-N-acetyl-D-mannosaminuronic acid dehydrogenase